MLCCHQPKTCVEPNVGRVDTYTWNDPFEGCHEIIFVGVGYVQQI
jgi:hypothetical protein